jgi:glycine dehydrogenase subunit 1
VQGDGARVVEKMARKGVLAGVPASRLWPKVKALKDVILVANTEVNTDDDRAAFVAALGASL